MRIGLASLGLVLLLVAGPARADVYDETEYRLKTAGIDEDLRERIHAAIRRGVAHLRKYQRPDGSFSRNPGHTALAGLALRHAAIPDGVAGGRAAIRWLEKAGRRRGAMTTYGVGLLAMLLTADGSHAAWNKSLHARLAKGPRKDKGYWGYEPAGGRGSNLSTAQFGCLGLWAGERAGAPTATKTWQLHLDALLLAQQSDGSWSYNPGRAADRLQLVGFGYRTGTYMGLADLALAAAALREELGEDPKRWSRTLIARSAAHAALRRHVAWEVDSVFLPATVVLGNAFPFYRLYALEKVCIFVDLEDVAGRRWYEEGARRLLAAQAPDGSWSSGATAAWGFAAAEVGCSPIDTSFALLFLLRASHAYHPITPRPVERSRAVITPGDDPLEPQPEAADPAPGISLETANPVLDTLGVWLGQKKLETPGPAIASFARICEIYREYRPDGTPYSEPHDAWCRRAEAMLLDASTRFLAARPRFREPWQAVGLLALDTLAVTDRRVAPALMRKMERMPETPALAGAARFGWFSAAFDSLRRLDAPVLAPWIVERMLSDDGKAWARTSSALTTLGGIRGLKGRQRRAAARAVLDWLVARHRRGGEEPPSPDLQFDGLVAMRRLARAGCDHFPVLQSGSTGRLVQSVETWWRQHGAKTDPAWAE